MLIVHLDGGDAFGGKEVSITRDGDEAILNEVVGPCLIAVDTCVDMMCVSIIRATTGALPIVGDEGRRGRKERKECSRHIFLSQKKGMSNARI